MMLAGWTGPATGDGWAGADPGGAETSTVRDSVDMLPSPSMLETRTVYVPADWYSWWAAFVPVAVPPSPKSQLVTPNVDQTSFGVTLNESEWPTTPELGIDSASRVGPAASNPAAWTVVRPPLRSDANHCHAATALP
jgi:hypothetical protein